MPPNILLVTEPGNGTTISRVLHEAGHRVQGRHTIAAAHEALDQGGVDLTLADPARCDVDPALAIRAIRARTRAPIVLIDSGDPAQLDRMLAAGADDFISKPFTAAQLKARVKVVLARHTPCPDAVTVGGIRIDAQRRRAWLDGTPLQLSRREFDVLRLLAERAGEVVSRRELAVAVWPESTSDFSRTIDVHLSWLRRKLGDTGAHPRYLHTVRGIGFRLACEETR